MYRQTQTQTAAPGELVLMLYRGALRFVGAAIEAIEARNISEAHNKLLKTQDIISYLIETLDVERGGEVAKNLESLYGYMLRRLIEANVKKDGVPAREVQGLLRELLPAWEAAVRQMSTAPAGTLVGAGR
ncbi:MAG: flagellar export chaperone FliS [Chloroflexi bacterium]|nr:flagellar export chaperone FliS [Chloroflexota bacterium]